jgi:hypothetical protein
MRCHPVRHGRPGAVFAYVSSDWSWRRVYGLLRTRCSKCAKPADHPAKDLVQLDPLASANVLDFKGFFVVVEIWCPGEDSNLHEFLHWYLKPARLPVPPPGQEGPPTMRRGNLRTRPRLVNQGNACLRSGADSRLEGSCFRISEPTLSNSLVYRTQPLVDHAARRGLFGRPDSRGDSA